MKKLIAIFFVLLFALTSLSPVGILLCACIKYTLELTALPVFALIIAILSLCVAVLSRVVHVYFEHGFLRILSAVILPLSLINGFLFLMASRNFLVTVSVLLSVVCSFIITLRHGKPLIFKILSFILTGLMLIPIVIAIALASILDGFNEDRVTLSLNSPNGKYCAMVISSDQGALGGCTYVDVTEKEIDLLLLKLKKERQRVYEGDYGEHADLQIYWKDENCLVINSVEYEIE